MSFFHHLSLSKPDPLGGGLAEEIVAEQQEPDAITLDENVDANLVLENWQHISEEFSLDPEWTDLMQHEHQ